MFICGQWGQRGETLPAAGGETGPLGSPGTGPQAWGGRSETHLSERQDLVRMHSHSETAPRLSCYIRMKSLSGSETRPTAKLFEKKQAKQLDLAVLMGVQSVGGATCHVGSSAATPFVSL